MSLTCNTAKCYLSFKLDHVTNSETMLLFIRDDCTCRLPIVSVAVIFVQWLIVWMNCGYVALKNILQ